MAYHEERSAVWKVIAFVVLAFAAWFAFRGDPYVKESERRVKIVLEAMQKGSHSDGWIEQGITHYARGVRVLPSAAELDAAEKGFKAWRAQKGLDDHQIAVYSINRAEVIKDSYPQSAIVEVTIEGKPYAIRTTRGEPLVWDR
jgi:hypothetical protein